MEDKVLEEQASIVAGHVAYHEGVGTVTAFDPATIAVIIQALVAIYQLLKEWGYFTDDAAAVLRDPNFIQRWYAKRAIAKVTGIRNFTFKTGQTNEKIYNGISKMAKTVSGYDVARAYMAIS